MPPDSMVISRSTFSIDELSFEYTVKRTKRRRKTLSLSLHPHEGLVLLIPWWTHERDIHSFLSTHCSWIISRMKGFKPLPRYELTEGEPLFFEGQPTFLEVAEGPRLSKSSYEDGRLQIRIKPSEPELRTEAVYAQLKKFCYKKGHVFLSERLDYWKQKLGVEYHSLKITNPKRRWGSCDGKNIIRLNWRIMLTPLDLIDYLLVHELCHVKHKNHSREYWAFVASVMPDHADRRKQLHKHPAGFLGLT